MLKINVGSADRVVRILIGALLLGAHFAGYIGAWGWLGVVPLLTGIFRICPAYLPFGISTCKTK